jgi:hypothetical protein
MAHMPSSMEVSAIRKSFLAFSTWNALRITAETTGVTQLRMLIAMITQRETSSRRFK